jgi:hypothetical protein
MDALTAVAREVISTGNFEAGPHATTKLSNLLLEVPMLKKIKV